MAKRKDARVSYHGNIWLVTPYTRQARQWIDDNVQDDAMWYGGSLVVDQHYIDDLVNGMVADGLLV